MAGFNRAVRVRERIVLDGHHFERITFDHCVLVFAATAPVQLEDCRFVGCQWLFEGAAALTVDFLRAMGLGGGEEVIAAALPFTAEGAVKVTAEVAKRSLEPATAQ